LQYRWPTFAESDAWVQGTQEQGTKNKKMEGEQNNKEEFAALFPDMFLSKEDIVVAKEEQIPNKEQAPSTLLQVGRCL